MVGAISLVLAAMRPRERKVFHSILRNGRKSWFAGEQRREVLKFLIHHWVSPVGREGSDRERA